MPSRVANTQTSKLREAARAVVDADERHRSVLEGLGIKPGKSDTEVSFARAVLVLEEALEELKLWHEHAPNLSHTRALGDSYGWCDYCATKVYWGPCPAVSAIAKAEKEFE